MKKFVFMYYGYWEPTQEIMDGWTKWFASISDHIVDGGNPFGLGREVTPSGTRELTREAGAVGYSIVNADNMDAAVKLLETCPIITSVQVYEAMSM